MEEIIVSTKSKYCTNCPGNYNCLDLYLPEHWRRQQFSERNEVEIEVLDICLENFVNIEDQNVTLRTFIPDNPNIRFTSETVSLKSGLYGTQELIDRISSFFPGKIDWIFDQEQVKIVNISDSDLSMVIGRKLLEKLGLKTTSAVEYSNISCPSHGNTEINLPQNEVVTGFQSVDPNRDLSSLFVLAEGCLVRPGYFVSRNSEIMPSSVPVIGKFNISPIGSKKPRLKVVEGMREFCFFFTMHPLQIVIVDGNFDPLPANDTTNINVTLKLKRKSNL